MTNKSKMKLKKMTFLNKESEELHEKPKRLNIEYDK